MAGLNVSSNDFENESVEKIASSVEKSLETENFKENLYKAIKDPNFDPDAFIDSLLF